LERQSDTQIVGEGGQCWETARVGLLQFKMVAWLEEVVISRLMVAISRNGKKVVEKL